MTKIAINYALLAVAVVAFAFALATPAYAAMNSSSIRIETVNRGTIDNYTSAKAYTGANDADGSEGGRGGDGGEVEADGDNNNGGAMTGDGGNGGDAGAGGLIDTGDAAANAQSDNVLNSIEADIDAPQDMNSSEVVVDTNNRIRDAGDTPECACDANNITNDTQARAYTGRNDAEGSEGGNGDDGGDVEGGDGDFNNGGATTGNGGDGGDGDVGGTVYTGRADAISKAVNLLNTVFVRVSRL